MRSGEYRPLETTFGPPGAGASAQPVKQWELSSGRRNEALDTLTYTYAARGLVGLDLERRESDLANVSGPSQRVTVARSKWLDGYA